MFFLDLIIALIIALILSTIFVFGFRRRGPWPNFFFFFIIIFLATWAGGLWLTPIGPSIGGVFLLPFLLVGAVFALLLAAATPAEKPTSIELKTRQQVEKEKKIETAVSIFFWILIVALAVAIIFGYWNYPAAPINY